MYKTKSSLLLVIDSRKEGRLEDVNRQIRGSGLVEMVIGLA